MKGGLCLGTRRGTIDNTQSRVGLDFGWTRAPAMTGGPLGSGSPLRSRLQHIRRQDILHRGGALELNTEKVSNEGSRGAEDEDPGFPLSSGIESAP